MQYFFIISTFTVVKCLHNPKDPYGVLGDGFSFEFDTNTLRRIPQNTSRPYMVTDPIPEDLLAMKDPLMYDKYAEDEYLKNLNKRKNETLILLDTGGFIHRFTKTYLQRRMINLAVPVANAYSIYLRKQAIKKINETEADFRYNSNKVFYKKYMLERLHHYYCELIFQHIPKIKESVLDAGFEDRNGSMSRNDYHELWKWESNFTSHFRDIADHLALARNFILGEGDVALYSSFKPAFFMPELNNLAFTAEPFEDHYFKLA